MTNTKEIISGILTATILAGIVAFFLYVSFFFISIVSIPTCGILGAACLLAQLYDSLGSGLLHGLLYAFLVFIYGAFVIGVRLSFKDKQTFSRTLSRTAVFIIVLIPTTLLIGKFWQWLVYRNL